ncbi:hypothetical protein [Streptosporangium sp. NPDC002524]|uniref:hypothetical protein n=1 Tax=Streptosporangium sp. NPDC002524 TaxID=3154537 RepID=UPI0033235CA5
MDTNRRTCVPRVVPVNAPALQGGRHGHLIITGDHYAKVQEVEHLEGGVTRVRWIAISDVAPDQPDRGTFEVEAGDTVLCVRRAALPVLLGAPGPNA